MTTRFNFFITLFLTFAAHLAQAQGCSDAGVCTINSFKPNTTDSVAETKNQFKIGFSYGSADNAISVVGSYLEYNRQLSKKFAFDTKITSLYQTGNNIAAFGLSDLYVNGNYRASEKIRFTLGVKIPFTNGNKMKDNLPLPMDYQSSLGTFDLIAGVGCKFRRIHLVAAIQQPLTQNNNQFLAEYYSMNSKLQEFQSTNQFKRSADALIRASYEVSIGKKFKLTPSLLPIYHLANDKYTDAMGNETEIKGSKGLTFNGNLYFDYEINDKNILQLNAGMPFITREVRPDGLTRHFIANLEYRFKF